MKKIILTFAFAVALNTVNAQNEETTTKNVDFNKWSVELDGGFNKTEETETYDTALISPFTVDLGLRYMFNNKFGLKLDFGYNSITGNTYSNDFSNNPLGNKTFDTQFYRVGLQGVINLGRALSFENWTKTIGLLAHTGAGVGYLKSDGFGGDKVGHFIIGLTGQIKLSNRFVITGDMTTIANSRQQTTYDYGTLNNESAFNGIMYNGTLGLTYYLGKNAVHADWFIENEGRFEELENKLADLENKLTLDTDGDGVPDYRDEESITPAGALVDAKGRSLDKNNNGVPDATEAYILKNYGDPNNKAPELTQNDVVTNLINDGYVALYFDSGKSTPTAASVEGTRFMLSYLKNNPTSSIDIIGSADETGNTADNLKLSNDRAAYVKEILVKAGVEASRLNVIGAGEDKTVDKKSIEARKLVRKVTFEVK